MRAALGREARVFWLAAISLTGAAVAAASVAEGAAAQTPSIRATELTPPPDPTTSFNRMAQAMGLFAKHGLKLDLGPKLAGGGPARVQAVVAGATDVATGDIIAAMGGIYAGSNIKVIMIMTPYGDEEVWGRKKYKTMKDAMGQTWGVASLAGAQRFNDQMAIEGMGLPPDAFRWVAIPGSDGPRLQAVETGRTQLATLSHMGAELAKVKGFTSNIHVLMPHTAKYTPPVPRLAVVAREDWIKSHEDIATRYVETMLDMSRQWEANPDAWVKPAQKIFSQSGLSADQLKAVWKEFRDGGYFSINGGINMAGTQKVMDLFFKIRKQSPNSYLKSPQDVYDTGPLKAALDKMGVVHVKTGLQDVPDWYKGSSAAAK